MNRKKYNQIRVVVTLFISAIVAASLMRNSYLLSIAGMATGMIFMALMRSRAKIRTDERETVIKEKAAQMAYKIFAPTIGIGAFLLLIPSHNELFPVFAKGEFAYLESLGMVFAYLALFLITIYAISYYFLNRKYGGGNGD